MKDKYGHCQSDFLNMEFVKFDNAIVTKTSITSQRKGETWTFLNVVPTTGHHGQSVEGAVTL